MDSLPIDTQPEEMSSSSNASSDPDQHMLNQQQNLVDQDYQEESSSSEQSEESEASNPSEDESEEDANENNQQADEGTDMFSPEASAVNIDGDFEVNKKKDELKAPDVCLEDPHFEYYLDKKHISGWDIETTEIRTKAQIMKLKLGLQLRFPMFCSDIIKILLYRKEMDLACYMTAFYNLWIEKELVINAVEFRWLRWVQYVFAFNKNILSDAKKKDDDEPPKKILFKNLFGAIDKYYTQPAIAKEEGSRELMTKEIVNCCKWKLKMDDNILEALLFHHFD